MRRLRQLIVALAFLVSWVGLGSPEQGSFGVQTAAAAQGCGPGWRRGPYGGCRPIYYGGGYYGRPAYHRGAVYGRRGYGYRRGYAYRGGYGYRRGFAYRGGYAHRGFHGGFRRGGFRR